MLPRALIALCFLLPTTAAAQSGFGFDPSKETFIDAEYFDRQEGGRRLILDKGVTVSQPGVILKASRIEMTVVPETNEIVRLVAIGTVRYANVAGDAIAGERAVYIAAENSLNVTGDVVVLQDSQVATGSALFYNTVTGAMTMRAEDGGRVRGLFANRGGQ